MDLLQHLNPEQREAVTTIDGPLLVLAGPGSGKTRVITTRIAHMLQQGIPGWKILAMTFTNKAAAEMRRRVEQFHPLGELQISTFHSFGAWLMRREAGHLGYQRDFSIYDTDDRDSLVRRIMKELKIDSAFVTASTAGYAISDAKNRGIDPATYRAGAYDVQSKCVADIYERYEKALVEAQAMDFDDLLVKPLKLFTAHPDVLEKYRGRFGHLMIDEYQDTNSIQYRVSRLLAAEHKNICVTGDPDQSIYSWRGADIQNILNFERDFPATKVVVLGQNYRSTRNIVRAADSLVRHNVARKDKRLTTDNEEGARITVMKCQTETHEARAIAARVETLRLENQVGYGDVAIFYRTNAQSRALEQALLERTVPYQLVGAVSFYQRQEIKDVLAYVRLLLNPRDPVAFARTLTRPSRGVGEGTISKIHAAALDADASLLDVARDPKAFGVTRVPKKGAAALKAFAGMYEELLAGNLYPIEGVIEKVLDQSGYKRMLETDIDPRSSDRLENVHELVSDARTKEQENPELDLSAWLEQIALVSDTDKLDIQGDAVKLMTLHSAKGLEFPAVFLTGLEDGVLPHARSIQGDGDIEEERRLCYVGITRAQRHLTLSLARHREAFGRSQRNAPSRFLTEIPPELTQVDDQAAVASGYGSQEFSQWFTGRAGVRPAARVNDDDDPFDFSDVPAIEDGPADHLAGEPRPAPDITPSDPSELQSGDRVKHAVFGIGKVLDLSNTGRVKVHFQGWGEKSLALEFARLEKL
ncbi:MAG: UvrD-helicase domain-containing protein [Planctomycetes bacterium]|nr:UvrD-helicase domain-containing protein [Planctomycetota bacterium]